MTPNRPYFLRAVNDWIIDNGLTPHLLVDATYQDVVVPEQYIDDGKIILNISPVAIQEAEFGNEWILFSARFSGVKHRIEIPIQSVIAIYAKENGRGMVFPDEPAEDESNTEKSSASDSEQNDKSKTPGEKPHLTVVK